jgi:hypothetical protein
MKLVEYASFNSINAPNSCLFSLTVIFHFSDRWSLFRCAELFKCVVHFCCDFSLVRGVFLSVNHMLRANIFSFCRTESTLSAHNISQYFCIFFLFYFCISFSFFFSFLFLFIIFFVLALYYSTLCTCISYCCCNF